VEPEQIYARAREEGRRRLARPVVELVATALVGGFDVAFGVVAFALAAGAVSGSVRPELAHLVGALAFGIGFVFVVVGKSELFTETSSSRSPGSSGAAGPRGSSSPSCGSARCS